MFLDSLDIANRALMLCEAQPIASITEDSTNNTAITFVYDKVRRAELRRNIWRFATRKVLLRAVDTNTMILAPNYWNATTVYPPGALVSDLNSVIWVSLPQDNQDNLNNQGNINNPPGGNNEAWDTYFGPMTVEPYDTSGSTAYYTGELVYLPGTIPGTYVIYQSLMNANANVPNDGGTPWDPTVTYHSNMVVLYGGSMWISQIEVNLNITPVSGPAAWSVTTTYNT